MKLATIGSGVIVELFLDALSQVEDMHCEAVYSRTQTKAQALADKFGVKKTYTSLTAMFDDPKIDVIYVASPNSLHFEQAKQALLANKHVICEKPLTSTLAELDELLEIAHQRDKIFVEAITTIHLPNFNILKENLTKIGEVKMILCSFLQYSSRMDLYKKGEVTNVFNPEFSGGALMDLNVYNLHFVIGLFGKPTKASYYPQVGFNGIDLAGVALLEYPTMSAVCVAGKNVQAQNTSMIYGELGSIKIDGEVNSIEEVVLNDGKSKNVLNNQSIKNRMVYEAQVFADIINNHDTKRADALHKHSRDVYEVLHKMRRDANIIFDPD